MSDKALEEAAFALYAGGPWGRFITFVGEYGQTAAMDNHSMEVYREMVKDAIPAYLDGLLSDLPEEAVEAAENAIAHELPPSELDAGEHQFYAALAIPAFLRSLRGDA